MGKSGKTSEWTLEKERKTKTRLQNRGFFFVGKGRKDAHKQRPKTRPAKRPRKKGLHKKGNQKKKVKTDSNFGSNGGQKTKIEEKRGVQ